MSKKEIIEKIRETTGCSEEKAEIIFRRGIKDKHIIVRMDWEWIINRMIIGAVVLMGIWAIWQHLK
tara:strand:+ start:293 stop:490 length:198 start_codon:yes stop_codon:yes gene_type:complete